MNTTLLILAAIAPWQTPEVNEINRLPARPIMVPCESEERAFNVKRGFDDLSDSRWVQSLNGEWYFAWKRSVEGEWEKQAMIAVPGCWQLQGEYDPPLYVNTRYPIAFDGSGDPTKANPTNYTSATFPTPVGIYARQFKTPWSWRFGRRTVLHFNGVSSAFYVRVNGKDVGYGEDSRLPSEFDITPYLKWFGENLLEVIVLKHSDGTYLEDQDFWRFSGIFRDVYLVSELNGAPKSFRVETELSDDYKVGRFRILDENGKLLKEREVKEPKLWSCEEPALYLTPIEFRSGWGSIFGAEYYAVTVGFRKIEIKDGVMTLNGKRLVFKGVNRHEMHPERGYTVLPHETARDLRLMKSLNLNAVRTCHYPDDPSFYDLCDIEGMMVICEANVESHGAGYGEKSLAKDPRWQKAHVERCQRMIETYRNHPSIVLWSMGNEAGDGVNFEAAYRAMKALDPTRPIHYERADQTDHVDIDSTMYTTPANIEKRMKSGNQKRPYILCEFSHAMGNSNGDFEEYMELTRKYPSFQGGFIWDFADQAVWKHGERGKYLAYGGDFGDSPNDGNFNCNGIVDALRNQHPACSEIKHVYRPIRATDYDWAKHTVRIANDQNFVGCDKLVCKWRMLDRDGNEIGQGEIDIKSLGAGQSAEFKVVEAEANSVTFKFYRESSLIAWDDFTRPFAPVKVSVGDTCGNPGFKLNFWRAPTDNDRGWKMEKVCKVWKEATASQQLPRGVKSELKFSKLAEGETLVDWQLSVPKGLPPIPRVGLTFNLTTREKQVSWFGLGPWENYVDRATGAMLDVHKATVELASGLAEDRRNAITYAANRLNPDNYIEPGEQGYRTGARWLKVGDVTVSAVNAPFGFNVWPYPQSELEGKAHVWEMKAADQFTVNIDAAQMGVGGDDSWGARPHDGAMLGAGTYHLVFKVKGEIK